MHPRFKAAAIHAAPVFLDPTGARIGEGLRDGGILCAEIDLTVNRRRLAPATFRDSDPSLPPTAGILPQAGDGA